MKLSIQAGATSQSINVFISDSSSTTGAGLTGLVYNSGSLTAYYSFTGANATATAITLATLSTVTSAYSSGGFKEIDATNMPGWYRLDLPNAVLATSKGRVVSLLLKGATNMAPCPVEIELTGWDNQDTVRGGLTALPNVASGSAGAIPTVGTGTAQINVSGGRADANVTYFNGSAGTFSSGRPEVNASYVGGSAVASGVLPNVAAGSTGGLILIGTGTRDINPNAGGVVITSTGMDDVAAHVWDLAYASHNTAGTFGYQVQNIATGSPPTAAAIASQVRTELTTELGRIDVATSTRLAPTTAGRTLDVSTTGEAGLDFDNIKDASSSHTLTNITVPVVTTTGTVNALANDVITAASIATDAGTEIATAVWDLSAGIETGVTPRQALRYCSSILVGVITTAGTGTEVFKAIGNAGTTRVTVTDDATGNRSAVTLA